MVEMIITYDGGDGGPPLACYFWPSGVTLKSTTYLYLLIKVIRHYVIMYAGVRACVCVRARVRVKDKVVLYAFCRIQSNNQIYLFIKIPLLIKHFFVK